jgi:hypothetical protein
VRRLVISVERQGESRRQCVSAGPALGCLAVVLLDAGADLLSVDRDVLYVDEGVVLTSAGVRLGPRSRSAWPEGDDRHRDH